MFRQNAMESGYGYLWNILTMLGIPVPNSIRKPEFKGSIQSYFKLLFLTIFLMFLCYFLYELAVLASALEIRTFFPLLIVCILSNALWVTVYKRRYRIKKLLIQMHQFSNTHLHQAYNQNLFLNIILLVFFAVKFNLFVLLILGQKFNPNAHVEHANDYGTIGSIWNRAYQLLMTFIYEFEFLSLPCFMTLLICALYNHFSFLQGLYENKLLTFYKDNVIIDFVFEYTNLIDIAYSLDDILQVPAFLIVAIQLLLMFNSLQALVMVKEVWLPTFLTETLLMMIIPASAIFILAYVASVIHIKMKNIKMTLEDLYDKELHQTKQKSRSLSIIKAMAEKEIFAMSAWGMIYFTRNYILSVFGGFFTYALLFINIKQDPLSKC